MHFQDVFARCKSAKARRILTIRLLSNNLMEQEVSAEEKSHACVRQINGQIATAILIA